MERAGIQGRSTLHIEARFAGGGRGGSGSGGSRRPSESRGNRNDSARPGGSSYGRSTRPEPYATPPPPQQSVDRQVDEDRAPWPPVDSGSSNGNYSSSNSSRNGSHTSGRGRDGDSRSSITARAWQRSQESETSAPPAGASSNNATQRRPSWGRDEAPSNSEEDDDAFDYGQEEEEEGQGNRRSSGVRAGSSSGAPRPWQRDAIRSGNSNGGGAWGGGSSSSSRKGDGGGAWGRSDRDYAADGAEEVGSIRDEIKGQVLYGVFPVLAAFRCKRRTIHSLYVFENMDMKERKDKSAVEEVVASATQQGIPIHYIGRRDLNLLSDDRPHQGLVADVSELEWESLQIMPFADEVRRKAPGGSAPPVWLALDEVADPQNLGALIRSAYCLGATGVLACEKNCAPLSAVVSKASAGALEAMQLHSCNNMPRTLEDAVKKGWSVVGAAADSNAVGSRTVSVRQPTILVVGSEGFGLRTNVRRACTQIVKVEMGVPGPGRLVDSLNVSVATGILLHTLIGSARALAQKAPADDNASTAGTGSSSAASSKLQPMAVTAAAGTGSLAKRHTAAVRAASSSAQQPAAPSLPSASPPFSSLTALPSSPSSSPPSSTATSPSVSEMVSAATAAALARAGVITDDYEINKAKLESNSKGNGTSCDEDGFCSDSGWDDTSRTTFAVDASSFDEVDDLDASDTSRPAAANSSVPQNGKTANAGSSVSSSNDVGSSTGDKGGLSRRRQEALGSAQETYFNS